MNKTENLSIAGYTSIEHITQAGNTKLTQSNYPLSTGIEVVMLSWYSEGIMKGCSNVVAAWHVKGTKQFNNSPAFQTVYNMKPKTLEQAIQYILSLNSPVLFDKHANFAIFDCSVYGMFEIMYDFVAKKWHAYREIGRSDTPTIQTLFYFD